MFPGPTELLLTGCLIESIWTQKSKSNTLTPRTNSQTYWPRGISHVMNGIIFCVCSTSAIPVPPIVLKWCRKERKKMQVKKESQQNRSRWWIWSRDAAWGILTCLPPLHQKAPGKPDLKSQIPLSSWNEQQPRTGRLVMGACSSDYSEWNIDEKWSSQEWKSDEMLDARTGRPVGGQPAGSFTQHTDKFVIDDDGMVSDTAHRIGPFVKVTVILAQSEWSIAKDIGPFFNSRYWQTFLNLGKVHVFNIGSICISWERNYSENLHSVKNTGNNLTMEQTFDISEKLIVRQSDEFCEVTPIS